MSDTEEVVMSIDRFVVRAGGRVVRIQRQSDEPETWLVDLDAVCSRVSPGLLIGDYRVAQTKGVAAIHAAMEYDRALEAAKQVYDARLKEIAEDPTEP